MPKYRMLSLQELEELKEEFIEFLIVNGIAAEDWERMKSTQKEKAEIILELFSDAVLETVLRKINFIEYRTKNEVRIIQCLSENQVLVGIEVPQELGIDCSDPKSFNEAKELNLQGVKVFTTSKSYLKPREEEIFDLLESGGLITNDRLFKLFCLAL